MTDHINYLFDLYGTIIDMSCDEHSDETWKAWCAYFDERGIKHPGLKKFRDDFFRGDAEYRKAAAGKFEYPESDVCKVLGKLLAGYGNRPVSEAEIEEASWAFRKISTDRIALFPDVKEYLRALSASGAHVYMLSNAQASYTRPEIEMFGLAPLFEDIFLSSDYGCMKPDRAFYDIAIGKYGMDRSRTVMVGDTEESDVAGAAAAGIDCIHLASGLAKTWYTDQLSVMRKDMKGL